jgi:hypothetical protein
MATVAGSLVGGLIENYASSQRGGRAAGVHVALQTAEPPRAGGQAPDPGALRIPVPGSAIAESAAALQRPHAYVDVFAPPANTGQGIAESVTALIRPESLFADGVKSLPPPHTDRPFEQTAGRGWIESAAALQRPFKDYTPSNELGPGAKEALAALQRPHASPIFAPTIPVPGSGPAESARLLKRPPPPGSPFVPVESKPNWMVTEGQISSPIRHAGARARARSTSCSTGGMERSIHR